jgi:hypothetical protein
MNEVEMLLIMRWVVPLAIGFIVGFVWGFVWIKNKKEWR